MASALSIRPAQMKAFEKVALENFVREMAQHAQKFAPRLCAGLGGPSLRASARAAIRQAARYGLTNRGPARLFLEMQLLLGSAFDTDPQYPWAAALLRSQDEQMGRAEKLHARIVELQNKVYGAEGMNTQRAFTSLLTLMRTTPFPVENRPSRLQEEMVRIFPEKTAYMGAQSCAKLIQRGAAEARRLRLPPGPADAVLTVVMFAVGHGCVVDPFYPWVRKALEDESAPGADARIDGLRRGSAAWFERVLAAEP